MNSKTVRAVLSGITIAAMLGALVPLAPLTFADTGPSVTLSSTASSPTNDSAIPVTMTLDPGVDGVQQNAISVQQGSVSGFSEVSSTTYTFNVLPSALNGPNDQDQAHHNISVVVNAGQFSNNQQSNTLSFYDNGTAPVVAITGGPSEGSTIASGSDADFTFTVDDSNATVQCALNGGSYSCASPQDWDGSQAPLLADGSYTFSVAATNNFGTASSSVDFTVGGTATSSSSGSSGSSGSASSTPSSGTFTAGPSGSPTIAITSGPSEGATQTDGTADFAFTVSDASSTVMCGLNATTSADFYGCASPQSFSGLSDGSYTFEIDAGNAFGTSTMVVDFNEQMATSSSSSSGSTQNTSPSTAGSGGGGNGQIVGSSPTAPSGAGNNGSAGVPEGHTVIPTSMSPAIPEGTNPPVAQNTSPSTVAPVTSNSSGGAALVPPSAPASAAQNTSPSTVAPGVPNTGTESTGSATMTSSSASSSTSVYTPLGSTSTTTGVGAAAAASGSGIPGWVWAVILLIILAALLWWAYSAGSTTDNPRV